DEPAAAQPAVGARRQVVRLRRSERARNARGSLRGPQPARRVPLHVSPGRQGRVSPLFAARRRLRGRHPPSESAARHEGVVVSRAPFAKLDEYRARMGWGFKWVSSGGSDFNFDYQVSFTPEEMAAKRAMYNYTMCDPQAREREGHSIFYKDASGAVFHTYS